MPAAPKPNRGDLVLLWWDDICEENTWQDTEHPEADPQPCLSVGYVAQWTSKHVVLVRTYQLHADGTKTAGDRITYPRRTVKRWSVLQVPA